MNKVELIPIDPKWERLRGLTPKRRRNARIFLGEHSGRYQALRRIELALKTYDPLLFLKELHENAMQELIEAADNGSTLLNFWIQQEEAYQQAIDELKS